MRSIIENIQNRVEESDIKLNPKDKAASVGIGLLKSAVEMFVDSDETDIVKKLNTIIDIYEKKIEGHDSEYLKAITDLSKLINKKTSYR